MFKKNALVLKTKHRCKCDSGHRTHVDVYLLLKTGNRLMQVPLLNLTSCFQCRKFHLGLGGSNFCNNLLYFLIQCLQKKKTLTCQHLYSCSFGGRELAKSRRALRSPTAHLAPSAFALGKRQPAQIIKVRILTEVLCSKFSHILGWRTLCAHFPC